MEPFTHALLETVALRRGALVDALSHIIRNNPYQEAGSMVRSDMDPVLDAVVVLLKEALMDRESAVRRMFLDNILPDMLVGAQSADGFLHVAAAWNAMLITEIDRHIGTDYRDSARVWLADFTGSWLVAMARVASQAQV